MKPKLLLDENLSPWVATQLCEAHAIDACAVRDRGGLGKSDAGVLALAYAEDRVLVTANVADFEALARARDIHPGIILVEDGSLLRHEQLAVVRVALEALANEPDLVNRVLRVWLDGRVGLESLPPA